MRAVSTRVSTWPHRHVRSRRRAASHPSNLCSSLATSAMSVSRLSNRWPYKAGRWHDEVGLRHRSSGNRSQGLSSCPSVLGAALDACWSGGSRLARTLCCAGFFGLPAARASARRRSVEGDVGFEKLGNRATGLCHPCQFFEGCLISAGNLGLQCQMDAGDGITAFHCSSVTSAEVFICSAVSLAWPRISDRAMVKQLA